MDREILKWLNATISLRAASQRWLWCSCISSARLPSWSAYRPRQPRLGVEAAVSEAAASAAAVSAAEAGAVVAASVSEVEVATSATAGAGTSARIDRGSIGVIFTHDPDRTTKIRCAGRSGAPDFVFGDWEITPVSLCRSNFGMTARRNGHSAVARANAKV